MTGKNEHHQSKYLSYGKVSANPFGPSLNPIKNNSLGYIPRKILLPNLPFFTTRLSSHPVVFSPSAQWHLAARLESARRPSRRHFSKWREPLNLYPFTRQPRLATVTTKRSGNCDHTANDGMTTREVIYEAAERTDLDEWGICPVG